MNKQPFFIFAFLLFNSAIFALDLKYAPIVNTAIADLKTHSKLSLLQGHVAINVSSGNKELDAQFGEALQKAYPNFASKADTVNREDLYQMVVKTYHEDDDVVVTITVTNYENAKIAVRTVKVKNVTPQVFETLQHKTAMAAKNEFEAYLNSVFGNAGDVVLEARIKPDYIKSGLYFLDNEEYEKAIAEFKKEIELGGRKAEAYYYIGDAYLYQDKYDEAIPYYTQTITLNPVPVSEPDWDAYFLRGRCYLEKENYDKAIQDFNASEKLRPKNAYLFYRRGFAYFMKEHYGYAEADFTKSIALDSKRAMPYYFRGVIHRMQKNYHKAIADFSKSLKIEPDDVYAYYYRADSYTWKNNKPKAIADCKAALRIDPNHKDARELLAYLQQPPPPKEPFVMPNIDVGMDGIGPVSGSSNYGWELLALYPFVGVQAGFLRLSAFGGGGISTKPRYEEETNTLFLFDNWVWTYCFGGNLDFFFGSFFIGGGGGMAGGGADKPYPFIRGEIGVDLGEDDYDEFRILLKLCYDYNFDNNGFKISYGFSTFFWSSQ